MRNALQVVNMLMETPSIAAQFAAQSGWTFNPTAQVGGVNLDTMPPEYLAKMQQAGITQQWEFTDQRPNTVTSGLTFYVPANTPLAEIMKTCDAKTREAEALR